MAAVYKAKKAKLFLKAALICCIILAGAFFAGCSQEEFKPEKPNVPPKVDLSSKITLDEITQETSAVLETTWTPYTIDEIIAYFSGKRPKEVKQTEVKGGPVRVDIIYPPAGSLIDRPTDFRVLVYSESAKVDRVDFYLDGEKVQSSSSAPYVFSFNPDAYGKSEHTLKVVAVSGDFTGRDSIKFYNVVKGSAVIYPWKTSGGNIPYSYINNFYPPDLEKREVAMFTAYTTSNFYLDFKRSLNTNLAVLAASVKLNGYVVADQNPDVLFMKFYDYAFKRFNDSYLYQMALNQSPQQGTSKDYERFTFVPYEQTGQYEGAGTEGNIIPFYGINPVSKEIWLRINGQGPTKFYLEPIVIEYYAIEDSKNPVVKLRRTFVSGSEVKTEFYVSEPSFVTITAYDSSGAIRSYTEPKFEGWNEIAIDDKNTVKVRIKAVDCAGNTTFSDYQRVSR